MQGSLTFQPPPTHLPKHKNAKCIGRHLGYSIGSIMIICLRAGVEHNSDYDKEGKEKRQRQNGEVFRLNL